MKRFVQSVALVVSILLFSAGVALAFPVGDDIIYFNRVSGTTYGGEFGVYSNSDRDEENFLFSTFCVQTNEYLNFYQAFRVEGISDQVVSGVRDPRDLEAATKWLYWNFSFGDLSGTGFVDGSAEWVDALQIAIWIIQDEDIEYEDIGYSAIPHGHSYWNGDSVVHDWVLALISAAEDAVEDGDIIGDNVQVINLVYAETGVHAQNVLWAAHPVPEPGTLLLLGTGLLGLAYLRRRSKS